MAGRNWKRVQPTSLRHALELGKDYAKDRHNRSVDRIAELMGLADKWTLYKWISSGKIPANMIRPYEHACGCDYVTRWLAHSAGKLLIDIPTGRAASGKDLMQTHELFSGAMKLLAEFYSGRSSADETAGALTALLEDVAMHRGQVQKHLQPEFDFNTEEE